MKYETYIESLWASEDIASLHKGLSKFPNQTFKVKGPEGKTLEVNFKMIDDLLKHYNSGDITSTFRHIQEHWGNHNCFNMPDGRSIITDQNAFIDICSTKNRPYISGLKLHLPIHENDVNKMEVIMKKMYGNNPNFLYKYAPNGISGNQFGKILTIYIGEGLDSPEELHKFTKQLLSETQQYGIKTYTPSDLKHNSLDPNLLNDNLEWKVKGAEGKIYYSYDGCCENGYRGHLKYSSDVKMGEYIHTINGDRKFLKALNDPFEYEVDLNYDKPRSFFDGINRNHSPQYKSSIKSIQIGEGMGDATQENVRELYRRAQHAGLNSNKTADYNKTPNSYRLELEDTPEARDFIRKNLSPDRRSIVKNPYTPLSNNNQSQAARANPTPPQQTPITNNGQNPHKQRIIQIGNGMGDAAQENVRELYRRASRAGLNPNKTSDYNKTPSSYRLELEDTPEVWEFIGRNVSPDGRSIIENPHITPSNNKPDTDASFSNQAKKLQETLSNGVNGAKQTTTTTVEKINKGIQSAHQIQTRLTQAAAAKISALPGGTKALQAARTASNVGSKAAGPLILLSTALDPKGSREFVDDVVNLRVGKIASEAWEGTTQMVLHPVDTAQAVYDMASDAVQNRYKDAETIGDYVAETANAAGKGFLNIGDTVWSAASSIKTTQAKSINWLLQKGGSSSQIATDSISYEAYKKDPIAFLGNLIVPTTVNTETGLRSDDDLMSLISQDNPKALKAYIAEGKENVNRNIQGSYHGNNHSPYNTALQFAAAAGNIQVARVLYLQNGVNYNGRNSSTWETTLMTMIRHNAPDQNDPSFLTGKPNVGKFSNEEYTEYMTTQAMIDDLVLNKKVDLNAVNFAGQDVFLVAAESGNITTASHCLERGSNINRTALNGWNALHYSHHNQEMVSMLLEQGIDANKPNKKGETALMFALEGKPSKRNTNSVSMLLMASNKKGLNCLKSSPKHLKLLDQLIEEHPEAKDIILGMEGHPLQTFFKERYPEDASNYETQLAQENKDKQTPSTINAEQTHEQRTTNTTKTLAQNAHIVAEEDKNYSIQTRVDGATR